MRRTKVSWDSLPSAAPSLNTPNAASRSASDRRRKPAPGRVGNSEGEVTHVIVRPTGPGVQKTTVENVPMAAHFAKAGHPVIQERINLI
jgi:hypothetical protein